MVRPLPNTKKRANKRLIKLAKKHNGVKFGRVKTTGFHIPDWLKKQL